MTGHAEDKEDSLSGTKDFASDGSCPGSKWLEEDVARVCHVMHL